MQQYRFAYLEPNLLLLLKNISGVFFAVESKAGPRFAFFWVKNVSFCRVENWSKICLFLSQKLVQSWTSFWVKTGPRFSSQEKLLLSAGRMSVFNLKTQKVKIYHFPENWSIYVAQHSWTSSWLRLGPVFDSGNMTFLAILLVAKYVETTFNFQQTFKTTFSKHLHF